MPTYCPECNHEILPYLKTGELKETSHNNQKSILISYQLYICIYCKVVYYEEHETYEFKKLIKEEIEKEKIELGETKKVMKEVVDFTNENLLEKEKKHESTKRKTK